MKLTRIVTKPQYLNGGWVTQPIAFVIGNAWNNLPLTPNIVAGHQSNQKKISHWFTPAGRSIWLAKTVTALNAQKIPYRIITVHSSQCNIIHKTHHQVVVLGAPNRKKGVK